MGKMKKPLPIFEFEFHPVMRVEDYSAIFLSDFCHGGQIVMPGKFAGLLPRACQITDYVLLTFSFF